MKKLITIMASMATCLLFGDGFTNSGTSFEEYGEHQFDPAKDDAGDTDSNTYWLSTGDGNDAFVLTNYDGEASANTPAGVPRPDYFAASNNATFLAIDTSARLYRSAMANSQTTSFNPVTIPVDKGIYLDTLVKFTAAEDETGLVLEGTDKIAIAYVEHEDLETPANSYTNFVICAGYLGSPLSVTNYFAAVPADFDKDAWHRLTVRSFASIDAAGDVGFVVYLDEVPLTYDTAVGAGPDFAATGAAAAFYTSELHALFPSAIQSGDYKSSIAAVAFTGNGSVDDVTFTTDTPNFIKAGEQVRTEITLGTGVAAVTVTVGGDTVNPEDAAANPLVFNLPAGTTSFVLGVTADTANGYAFDEATGITLMDATYATADDTVTITGASPALTVKGTRNNVTYIDGEDQQQSSSSLATALAAAKAGSTITLAYSVDVADIEGSAFETYDITSGKDLVLDLNGKTITWNDDQGEEALFTVRSGASFRVIDSSVANTGAIVYTGEYVVFYNKGNCYIGATTGDKGPTIQGKLAANKAEAQIVRGKFDKATNGAVEFTWAEYIEEGSELVESLGDYWIVEPQSTPEPVVIPTYELTLPSVTGASAEVTSNDVVVADLTAIPSNTAVVVTWTLSEGYKLTDGSLTENITMDSNKEAAAPTVAEIQYVTLTITPVANCTIVVSNATDEVATGTKFDKDDEVKLTVYRTPAEDYELDGYAASEQITMDQNQTVTAAVKAAGGSYPSYIDDTTKQTKYDTWKSDMAAAGVDVGDGTAYEDAFLLNCKPAEVEAAKAAFKFTSISYDTTQKKWVATTTTGYNERDYNGTVTVKQYSDVGCTTESETGTFFKAVLQ